MRCRIPVCFWFSCFVVLFWCPVKLTGPVCFFCVQTLGAPFPIYKTTLAQQLNDHVLSCCDYSNFYDEYIMFQVYYDTFCLDMITVIFMMSVLCFRV